MHSCRQKGHVCDQEHAPPRLQHSILCTLQVHTNMLRLLRIPRHMMTLSQFMSLSLSFFFARHIHLVFALAVAAAAKDAAHDDEEGGEAGEEEDCDEKPLFANC